VLVRITSYNPITITRQQEQIIHCHAEVGLGTEGLGGVWSGEGLIADRGLEIVLLRMLRRGTERLGGVWHGGVGN
jgi:hypothetical protein